MFALAGVRPNDDNLLAGLEYLRQKVTLHPSAARSRPEARGNKTRYAAFGLMGLTAYQRPIEEQQHTQAVTSCVKWLGSNALQEHLEIDAAGQGWAEHPHGKGVSILSTSVAARALDRVPSGLPGAQSSRKLASNARRRIRSLARGEPGNRWWPQRSSIAEDATDEAASAALTSLAVLCLAEGGPISQDYARAGVRWLIENTHRWEGQREPEDNIRDTNWVHASCPLGLQAVLVPCAGIDPQSRELAAAISNLDRLWSEQQGEWHHGHPTADVSTSADLHAAGALRALRRSWRGFDPVMHILGGTRTRTDIPLMGGDKPHTIRWAQNTLTVSSADGTQLVQRPFSAQATAMCALLDSLTSQWGAQTQPCTLEQRSLSTAQLRVQTGISDLYEYDKRLNRAVAERSLAQRGRRCVIVERLESGRGQEHDRYALLGRELILT